MRGQVGRAVPDDGGLTASGAASARRSETYVPTDHFPHDPQEPMSLSPTRLSAVGLLSGCLFAQFGLQFLYQLALARWFGTSPEMDAFQAAQSVPLVISTILVGQLQYAFVPVFVREKTQRGDEAAWRLASFVATWLIPGVALLSAVGCLAAGPLTRVLFPGLTESPDVPIVPVFQVVIWLTWTVSVTAYLQTLHQAAQDYRPTAIAPVLGAVVTFAVTGWLYQDWGIQAVSWSAIAGALVTLVWQWPLLWRNFRPTWSGGEAGGRVWTLLWPVLLGAWFYKLDPLVDRYLASEMPAGSVSQLGYATRLMAAILTLTTNGVAMVVFPVMAGHAAAGRTEELRKEIAQALRFLVWLLVPLVVALGCFSLPLIHDLFERGRFTAHDSQAVAWLVTLQIGVLIGGSAGEILSKAFYSLGDGKTPTRIRAGCFLLGLSLKLWWGTTHGLSGLVLATSIHTLLTPVLDYRLLRQRLDGLPVPGLGVGLIRSLLASLGAAGAGWLCLWGSFPGVSLCAALVGGMLYLFLGGQLQDEFSVSLIKWGGQKLGLAKRPSPDLP